MQTRRPAKDEGAGVAWMLCVCAVVWAAAVTLVVVGGATVARHRAGAAADLGALAAAQALLSGRSDPCAAAALVAGAQGARVVECVVEAQSVRVVAEVRAHAGRLPLPAAQGRARAGRSLLHAPP